ncbi:hypothetical protein [Roseiterribacter gracilis]|uniref:Uncharacterized protein n=1 Tax=Roseiterribacter gracilis TaxID=2812848 RepID=A0A8S8XAA5_9PROT|nr:hypothetical protein TMPK1_03870 [Rhodospirillales bacterium TMPK1]
MSDRSSPARASETRDDQLVEIAGRAALQAAFARHRIESARPERDKGIDLIIYLDEPEQPFAGAPLQLKSSSKKWFGVDRKYEGMSDLLMAYVFGAQSDLPSIAMLTWAESASLISLTKKLNKSWAGQTSTPGQGKPRKEKGWGSELPRYLEPSFAPFWLQRAEDNSLLVFPDRWEWVRGMLRLQRRQSTSSKVEWRENVRGQAFDRIREFPSNEDAQAFRQRLLARNQPQT